MLARLLRAVLALAIIVAGPDLASLRNTKNIIDLLKSMRPYDSPPAVVLSMVGRQFYLRRVSP